jgi:hypothetical protein
VPARHLVESGKVSETRSPQLQPVGLLAPSDTM